MNGTLFTGFVRAGITGGLTTPCLPETGGMS